MTNSNLCPNCDQPMAHAECKRCGHREYDEDCPCEHCTLGDTVTVAEHDIGDPVA